MFMIKVQFLFFQYNIYKVCGIPFEKPELMLILCFYPQTLYNDLSSFSLVL